MTAVFIIIAIAAIASAGITPRRRETRPGLGE
jgi:hypothetical protein